MILRKERIDKQIFAGRFVPKINTKESLQGSQGPTATVLSICPFGFNENLRLRC